MATLFWSLIEDLLAYRSSNVIYYSISYAPANKIKLSDRRDKPVKLDTGRPTKRIKELLGISIQARLVCDMDREHLSVRGGVCHMLGLGIVRHEPLKFAQRNGRTAPGQN